MALIDKETIRSEIERRKNELPEQDVHTTVGADSIRMAARYDDLLAFLDSIQEQPDSEEKFRNLLDAMGDCGFSQDDILLLKSIWEDAGCQIPQREQPVEGLEEAAEKYTRANMYDGWDYERIYNAFIAGEDWQKAKMMEWVKERYQQTISNVGCYTGHSVWAEVIEHINEM